MNTYLLASDEFSKVNTAKANLGLKYLTTNVPTIAENKSVNKEQLFFWHSIGADDLSNSF
jgi:hypothetical protein